MSWNAVSHLCDPDGVQLTAQLDPDACFVAVATLDRLDLPAAALGLGHGPLQDQERPTELVARDLQVRDARPGLDL
jgi:hypothetical protein